MTNIKHVGRMTTNNRRVVVAYRVVPGEPDHCIVVTTENLPADEHDALMRIVESPAGQEAQEFALVMARSSTPDGRNMLNHFHQTGKMIKVRTDQVEMIPNRNSSILLKELNEIIAQQKGVTVADLALTDGKSTTPSKEVETNTTVTEATNNEVLTDEDLARQYRSQADALFKEAKRLRDQAEELSPTKRSTKKTEADIESV
jgi:hypothetical protein